MAEACVFCAIIAGDEPGTIVREWPGVIALEPLAPVVAGHLLVIPTDHVRDAIEDPDVTAKTMHAAAELATAPCNIIASVGREATQSVFHLHLHVVPRAEDDGLALPWYSGRRTRSGREVDVRITPAVSRTFAAPVTFHEPDEPVADVQAAFEAGEKGVTKPPAGAPQCTCPFIDVSSMPGKPEFVIGDPAGCEVHGQGRDAEIEAAKKRHDAEIEAAKRRARAAAGYTGEPA